MSGRPAKTKRGRAAGYRGYTQINAPQWNALRSRAFEIGQTVSELREAGKIDQLGKSDQAMFKKHWNGHHVLYAMIRARYGTRACELPAEHFVDAMAFLDRKERKYSRLCGESPVATQAESEAAPASAEMSEIQRGAMADADRTIAAMMEKRTQLGLGEMSPDFVAYSRARLIEIFARATPAPLKVSSQRPHLRLVHSRQ